MSKRCKEDGLFHRHDSPYIWASYTDASGQRVRRSTETTNANEAEAILAKWRLEAHRVKTWGQAPTRTFDELMLKYLKETQPIKRAAVRDLAIARLLTKFFTGCVMNTLGAKAIRGYIQQRRGEMVQDSTIRRELSMLGAAINYAIREWEWDIPNPVDKRKPRNGDDRIRWLTAQEAALLVTKATAEPRSPHLADFIIFGLHTGCRSQEMLGLEWSRVDLAQRLIYLPAQKNKGKRHVSVPLNETACALLVRRAAFRDQYCPESPWVFANKRGERIASVKTAFATACRKSGIVDFHPHDLRHTCAAWLVQAGVPLMEVRDLLRHTSVQVTEKYAHLDPKNVRNAVDTLHSTSRLRHVGTPTLRLVQGGK